MSKLLSAYDLQPIGEAQIKAAHFAQGCAAMLDELKPWMTTTFKPSVQCDEVTVFAIRAMIAGTPGDRLAYQAELLECSFVCELPF